MATAPCLCLFHPPFSILSPWGGPNYSSSLNPDMATNSFFFLFLFLLSSSASACDSCAQQARAGYLSSLSAFSAGACGYGSLALSLAGGRVAAASSSLLRGGGLRCGACYRVRCRDPRICSGDGVRVTLTDLSKSNDTELVLSRPAFAGMARRGMAAELNKLGIVDVAYERVPCEYASKNLSVRVEEKSRRPNGLALKFLYQGGQTDVLAVDVAQAGSSNWQYMTRDYGPVWRTDRAPAGPLQLRMVVTGGYDGRWVWAQKEVLPADWKIGAVYDMGLQISDIARGGGCSRCDSKDR